MTRLFKFTNKTQQAQHKSLFADDDFYVMQRSDAGDQGGLAFVLNNRGDWNGAWVQTPWNTRLVPRAWRGHDDLGVPQEKCTNELGWIDLWAPARGYAVYVPEKNWVIGEIFPSD